jgi:MYXO-CTERM domain-containing protein
MSSRFPLSRWLVLAFLIMGSQGAFAGHVSVRSDADAKGRADDAVERALSTSAVADHVEAVDQKAYNDLVRDRDSDVASFDRAHPFFAKLLSDSEFAQNLIAKWESNEKRFDAHHPFLARILAGMSANSPIEDARGINLPGTNLPLSGPSHDPIKIPIPVLPLAGGATPEPPSGVLMVLGLAGLGLVVARRRRNEMSRVDSLPA